MQVVDTFEQPVLWLGLAGFAAPLRSRLAKLVTAAAPGRPVWQLSEFNDADAWWLDGPQSRLTADGSVVVAPARDQSDAEVVMELESVDRPVAFSTPLSSRLGADFRPLCKFDPFSDASVAGALQQFEQWLSPVRVKFALGGQIYRRGGDLRSGVYQLLQGSKLLAVIDLKGWRIAVLPSARASEFEGVRWEPRPPLATTPFEFERLSLTQIMWSFAQRTRQDILPARYRTQPIHFRRSPRVPARALKDSQLLLLRELSREPAVFDALRERTAAPEAQLARDLASLYFAGSITCSAHRAAPLGEVRDFSAPAYARGSPLGPESDLMSRPDALPPEPDATAPTPLIR
jgi:hypothetical protein